MKVLDLIFFPPEGAKQNRYIDNLQEAGRNAANKQSWCITVAYKNTIIGLDTIATLACYVITHIFVDALWTTCTLAFRCQWDKAGANFVNNMGYSAHAFLKLISMPAAILGGLILPRTVWGGVAKAATPVIKPSTSSLKIEQLNRQLYAANLEIETLKQRSNGTNGSSPESQGSSSIASEPPVTFPTIVTPSNDGGKDLQIQVNTPSTSISASWVNQSTVVEVPPSTSSAPTSTPSSTKSGGLFGWIRGNS